MNCGPRGLKGSRDRLYHNNGDGTFTDVTEKLKIDEGNYYGLGVLWLDYDKDGSVDLFKAKQAVGLAGGFGRVPFMVGMMLIDEIVQVSEDEMKHSIAALIDSDQVLLEASGVAGIAAVLAGKVSQARKCVCVLTGGNIDAATLKANSLESTS